MSTDVLNSRLTVPKTGTRMSSRSAASGDVSVATSTASHEATQEWKLAPRQIDQSIGIVRADATVIRNPYGIGREWQAGT